MTRPSSGVHRTHTSPKRKRGKGGQPVQLGRLVEDADKRRRITANVPLVGMRQGLKTEPLIRFDDDLACRSSDLNPAFHQIEHLLPPLDVKIVRWRTKDR